MNPFERVLAATRDELKAEGAARSVVYVGTDPEDESTHVMAHIKSNESRWEQEGR